MIKIFILTFLYSTGVFSSEIHLYALQAEQVRTGDIVSFKVETEKEFQDLLTYKNKKIAEILYVLDITEEGDSVFIRAILAPIDKKTKLKLKKDDQKQPEDIFFIKNLNYKEEQIAPLKDFVVLSGPEVLISEKTKKGLILFGILLLFSLCFIVGRKLFIKSKIKKRILLEKKKRIILIREAATKKEIENVYLGRKKLLRELEYDQKKLKRFVETINEIQYKKNCTDEEFKKLELEYKSFSETVRISDGV